MKNNQDKTDRTINAVTEVSYYCPMHCEGDKTYDEPGKCPVCGMFLEAIKGDAKKAKTPPCG